MGKDKKTEIDLEAEDGFLKYAILFRKPSIDESVILNVDLSGLGPYLQIFNSGRKQVLLVEELRKLHGDKFVEVYLDSFK